MSSFNDELIGKDQLTGLHDPAYLEQRLKEEVHRAVRYEQPFTLVLMDIVGFSLVTGAHGRPAGNQLLLKLAYVLKQSVRESDVAVRQYASGFGIILMNATREKATSWVQRVRKGFEASFEGDHRFTGTQFAVGLCTCPDEAITVQTVMGQAETALYEEVTRVEKSLQ